MVRIVIFLVFIFSFVFGKGGWWQWDIQRYLYEKYEKAISDDSFSVLVKDKGFVDVYKFVYSKLKKKKIYSYKSSIDRLQDILLDKGCNISRNDFKKIFTSIYFGNFSKFYEGNFNKIDNKEVFDICGKIINCLSPDNDINIDNCRRIIAIYLNFFANVNDLISNMKLETNEGDDILINGDSSDGFYDLLVDIEEIKKILFQQKSFEKAGFVSFYGEDDDKDEYEDENEDVIGVGIESKGNVGINNVGLDSDQIKNVFNKINQNNKFWRIENNTGCLKNDNSLSANINELRILKKGHLSDNFRTGGINPYENNPLDRSKQEDFNKTFFNDLNVVYRNGSIGGDFTSLGGGRTICDSSSRGGMVGINICFIPSGLKIPPKDKVYSIEDILNQLLRILVLLKDSGQITKEAYTDEFWETRLQDIKLSRIFVFDIIMLKKRLFPEKYTHKENKNSQIKKEIDEYKNVENLLQIVYSEDIDDKREKNKYVVLGGISNLYGKYKYTKGDYFKVNKLTEEENIGNIQKIFYDFLETNLENWESMDWILLQARQVASYFYNEILKGVNK